MPKVLIVGDNFQYGRMFRNAGWDVTNHVASADLIQFTGGEDVTPHLYGEALHPYTGCSFERDLYEAGYYAIAKHLNIPMAGICRGGQFLNVMCGGTMYQHVEAHATGHNHELVDINTGRAITVSSTHHQMMVGAPNSILVAAANLGGSKERMTDGARNRIKGDIVDTESLYYHDDKVLCFQPHPEFFGPGHECFEYYFELIERYHGLRA